MSRALRIGSYLAAALLGASLLLLLLGLGMAARPEAFAALGIQDTPKAGLAIALSAGIAAIGSTLLRRVLDLLEGDPARDGG